MTRGIQVGLYGQLATSNASPGRERGTNDLPIGQLFSTNPTSVNWLPGLHTDIRRVSAGIFAELDRRNDDVGLTRGHYLYARLATTDGLKHDRFSDFGWREAELDGQLYLPLGSDETSLALRSLAILKQPRGGSQIPFYNLAWMGGRTQHRGYRNFRFRGNNLLVLTVEPRRTIFSQSETRGLDLFVFGDAGQVWGDNRPAATPAARHFATSNWRYALGGGVQYRLNRSTAFRIDIGRGREELRVFFSVSRGF
ncbi:MAG: BamA/TamA family outer membrane protein [Acidobacteriota bacterium]